MKITDRQSMALLYALIITILYYFLPGYFLHPNDFLFSQNGDAMVIYSNMAYHICYGNNYFLLDNMNFPYGESIWMTDAQGAITITLKWLNQFFPTICHNVPGILHLFILFLIPLTGVFLFKIFRKLSMPILVSIIAAVLITLMSPQLMRVTGHFGLAYPFVLPMTIYFFLTKYNSPIFLWSDCIYIFVLFFFFLNNPYVGFAACSLLSIASLMAACFQKQKAYILPLVYGILPVLIGYAIIHFSDPYPDRIEEQWGFFFYFASLAGLFFPKGSVLYEIFQTHQFFGTPRYEGSINVGAIVTITILIGVGNFLYNRLKKKPMLKVWIGGFQYIFWAAFLIFLYAANYSLYGFAKEFIEEYLGPFLMFKASGRLAWSSYYTLSIVGIIILYKGIRQWKIRKDLKNIFWLAIFSIWMIEVYQFLQQRFDGDIYWDNILYTEEHKTKLDSLDIQSGKYEAIYLLPVIQTWNDKFMFGLDFKTQRAGTVVGFMTHTPMINGMMSRAPLKASISAIQLAADPLIRRSRMRNLSSDKPYLLVHGNQKQVLTSGERALLNEGKYIGEFLGAKIYEIEHSDFQPKPIYDENLTYPLLHESWENEHSSMIFSPPGSLEKPEGKYLIYQNDQVDTLTQGTIEISLWIYVDHRYHSRPEIMVDYDGNFRSIYNRSSRDYVGYWIRQKITLTSVKEIAIYVQNDHVTFIDDLQIRLLDSTSEVCIDQINFINNYPVDFDGKFELMN